MKPAVLCLLLLSACELDAARNYSVYKVTWTCMSPEGCERADDVVLIDRAQITDGHDFVYFESSLDLDFRYSSGRMIPSDELPATCSWLYGLAIFQLELEPSRFCRSGGRFELELSIPNDDPSTHSAWFVDGREIDP
jgi:hypothetical protein